MNNREQGLNKYRGRDGQVKKRRGASRRRAEKSCSSHDRVGADTNRAGPNAAEQQAEVDRVRG